MQNSYLYLDFFTRENCGILDNTAFTIREAWGWCCFDTIISKFSSHFFYKLGNRLKRSYISFRWCKENKKYGKSMLLLPSKFAGSSKFWLKFCGTHGGDGHSTWISQNIQIRFYKLGISLKRRYMSIRWRKENATIRICYMIFLLAKVAGSSKFWVKLCGMHVGWCWFDLNITLFANQIFYKFGISLKRTYISISWTKGNGEIPESWYDF